MGFDNDLLQFTRNGMSAQITSLFTLSLKPQDFPAFKGLVAEIVAATSREPGTLIYEYSVNSDHTVAHILERYHPDGVVSHIEQTFAPFAERFLSLVTITGLTVYGQPDAEVRKRLDPFGAIYMTDFGGFCR
jgi:quinol monooxygenase YgiN